MTGTGDGLTGWAACKGDEPKMEAPVVWPEIIDAYHLIFKKILDLQDQIFQQSLIKAKNKY